MAEVASGAVEGGSGPESSRARPVVRPEADLVLQQLGRRVHELRVQSAMTQEQLAELAGIHRVTISRIEAGLHNIGASYLPKLAAALSVRVGDLYGD